MALHKMVQKVASKWKGKKIFFIMVMEELLK